MPARLLAVRSTLLCFIAGSLTLVGCTWASGDDESAPPVVPPTTERQLVPAPSPSATFAPRRAPPTAVPTQTPVGRDQSRANADSPRVGEDKPAAAETTTEDASPSSEPASLFHVYELQEGDTLSSLAERFGIDADYLAWNNADVVTTMLVGAALRIPSANGMLHSVVVDQPLWTLAALYGVEVDALAALPGNTVTAQGMVTAGSTILVPGARPPLVSASNAASTTEAPADGEGGDTEANAEATPAATPVPTESPAASSPAWIPAATTTPPTPTPEATSPPGLASTASETATPSPTPSPEVTPVRVVTATPVATPRATPTPIATNTPAPTRLAAPRSSPTPPAEDAPRPRDEALAPGTYASAEADGDCLYIRDTAGLKGRIITCIPTGTIVSVLDGAIEADGYRWQKVSSGTLTGWAADMYLEPSAAPPPPPRTPSASPVVLSPASFRAALAASPWPVDTWPTVERIVKCESSFNTGAVGPLGHRGLMQVDPKLHGPVPSDPVGQLTQGYEVYKKQGWGAWECY
jgi:LysM repeat protein